MQMKRILVLSSILMAICAISARAEYPAGYYKSLEGKSGEELKTAVHNLIRNFTLVSSYNDLPRYFQRTDVYPGTNRWWEMYSDETFYLPSFKGMNREHSFPKSWWGGLTNVSAYVDLNHLYPSEADANMAKSNYPLGEVDRTEALKFDNGVSTVGYPVAGQGGGCQWVFEPDDRYKGDFARTYFYMATCYTDLTWKYTYMVANNNYPTLNGWASKMLLRWAADDPVDDKELDRNDVVYSIQNNRNPFIDLPELAEYLWGDKAGQPFKITTGGGSGSDQPTGDPVLITPTQGMSVDFGEIALGQSAKAELFFRGENLTGSLDLVITGTDKAAFSIPSNSLKATLVNRTEGTSLVITYTPAAIGEHSAKLIISEGGITGSRGIVLSGQCLAVPSLSAVTATAASDIEADSYRANWTPVAGQEVDYWIVHRTIYRGNTVDTEDIIAEESGIIIDGFADSDSESYTVQASRLGYLSPLSNVVFVEHAGITGIEAEQGLVVEGYEGCLRFLCSAPQTNVRIFSASGAEVMHIDQIRNNLHIDITPGVYMVVSDQCRRPAKVSVR